MTLDFKKIRMLMVKKNMLIKDLAVKMGITPGGVSKLFNRVVTAHSNKTINKVAKALGVNVEDVIKGEK